MTQTRLDFRKANFTRDTANDFSDDGSRFYGYIHASGMPMTYGGFDGDAYISLRLDYLNELDYDEYSKLESYGLADMYNGVPKEKVDMARLDDAATKLMAEYKEAVNKIQPVDAKEWFEYLKEADRIATEKYNKMRALISENFEVIIDHGDDWDVKQLLPYLKNIKEGIARVGRAVDIVDEKYKRTRLRKGIRWMVNSAEDDFYCQHIVKTIEKYTK